jgi:hypothetical protein
VRNYLLPKLAEYLNLEKSSSTDGLPQTDFDSMCEELRQADIILVEGNSRVSEVIKTITNSPWTHAAVYIGRLSEIKEGMLQNRIAEHYDGDPNEQLVIEAMLGEGTIVMPVTKYNRSHLRICRPRGLSRSDRHQVIAYTASQLGNDYDVRHLFDLARFLLPYSYIPKRWRSTLFEQGSRETTKNVCSTMLADAFASVNFPILPFGERLEDGKLKLYRRNTRLNTPKDFDYSPYFDIIKYPYFNFDEVSTYRTLPWDTEGMICNLEGDCFIPGDKVSQDVAPILEDKDTSSG